MIVSDKKTKALSDFVENTFDFIRKLKSKTYGPDSTLEIVEHIKSLIDHANDTLVEIGSNKDLNLAAKPSITNTLKSLKGLNTGYSRDLITYADLIRIVKTHIVPEVKKLSELLSILADAKTPKTPSHNASQTPNLQTSLEQQLEAFLKKKKDKEVEQTNNKEDELRKENEKTKVLMSRLSKRLPSSLKNRDVQVVDIPVIPHFKDWSLNKTDAAKRAGIEYKKYLTGFLIDAKEDKLTSGAPRMTGDYILILLKQKVLCFNKKAPFTIEEFLKDINERSIEPFAFVMDKYIPNPKNPNLLLAWIMEERILKKYTQHKSQKGVWTIPIEYESAL